MNARSQTSIVRQLLMTLLVVTTGLCVGSFDAQAADPVWTVKKFNQLQPRWKSLVGTRLRVEGRYSSLGRNLLRFENCPMSFRLPETLRPVLDSRNIQVTGQIVNEDDNLLFAVESLKELPSDEQEYRRRVAAIIPGSVDGWYALGEWALERADFYEDEALQKLAASANENGILAEYRDWNGKDTDALKALAVKAAKLKLPERRTSELLHQSFHLAWRQAQAEDAAIPVVAALLGDIDRELKGATDVPENVDAELQERYQRDPVGTYRDADAEARLALHRMLRSEIALHQILRTADIDGANGKQIAEAILEIVPEQAALAKSFRIRELKYRLSKIDTADRKEASALAAEFARLGQEEQGRQALSDWLTGREEAARRGGAVGLSRLAEDYITLADDRETAARLLVEAYGINPANKAISERLRTLGYVLDEGSWIAGDDVLRRPVDPYEAAIREGRILPGMTDEQVRRTLGDPATVSRAFLADRVSLVWTYGALGTSRLMVQFAVAAPRETPRVERVSKFAPVSRPAGDTP